jgi:hypothetical protein
MNNNIFFSPTRCARVWKKQMGENWKSAVMRLVVMLAFAIAAFLFVAYIIYTKNSPHMSEDYYQLIGSKDPFYFIETNVVLFLLFVFSAFVTSKMTTDLSTKNRRVSTLSIPVTSFENWFSRWFTYVVLFFIAFVVVIFIADEVRVLLFNAVLPADWHGHILHNKLNFQHLALMVGTYLFFQSAYILGSFFFPKNTFVKTSIIGFVYFMLLGFFAYLVDKYTHCGGIDLSSKTPLTIITFSLALINWVLSYFRFKEMEIIDRL